MKYDLHLMYARHNKKTPAPVIEARTIAYFELTLLFKGTLSYTVYDKTVSMQAGDVILLPPGALRSRKAAKEATDYLSFNFTSNEAPALPLLFSGAHENEVRLLTSAFDEIELNTLSDNRKKTVYLLACLLAVFEDKAKSEAFSPLTRQIIDFLHTHMHEKITLSDISRITFFSPVYCDSVFKRDMGRSIIDYLLHERIKDAKKRLLEGTLPLPALAQSLGFYDYNYFARVFKKRTGYTPTAYRKMIFAGAQY